MFIQQEVTQLPLALTLVASGMCLAVVSESMRFVQMERLTFVELADDDHAPSPTRSHSLRARASGRMPGRRRSWRWLTKSWRRDLPQCLQATANGGTVGDAAYCCAGSAVISRRVAEDVASAATPAPSGTPTRELGRSATS